MEPNKLTIPTVLVVFGATGDLMEKKIAPALFRLHKNGRLPKLFQVLSISHREMSGEDFQEHILSILKNTPGSEGDVPSMQAFVSLFSYVSGDFTDDNLYQQIGDHVGGIDKSWSACSNKLFYLAVPPAHYANITKRLAQFKLTEPCSEDTGYTRVLVEKPFGHDRGSAHELNELLSSLFKEEQIYRLDHYLGKRMLQNIMAFRFSNNFFEGAWGNKYIEKVEIKLLEANTAEGRGTFYDALGALRDVGQNHLLEFLAVVAMDNPRSFKSDAIRNARTRILEKLVVPSAEMILKNNYRAQYEGYQEHEGVEKNSSRETYFKLVAYIDHPLWAGVPFTLEAGKGLASQKKEVVITFKNNKNKMLFKLEPDESIQLDLWAKQEGYEMSVEEKRFLLNERDTKTRVQYTEEYEKLLLDAFLGDQTFFVSSSEVDAEWRFIDPIICAWDDNKTTLGRYRVGTDAPRDIAKATLHELMSPVEELPRNIALVGLGKMGANLAQNLLTHEWNVVGYNRSPEPTDKLVPDGLVAAYSLEELVSKTPSPRVVWLMLPHGEATTSTIEKLSTLLHADDIVIDGGNSFYRDAQKHYDVLHEKGIEFLDVGFSGGPYGALTGACLMVGGNKKLFEHLLPLFTTIGSSGGVAHFEGIGAGHFVKMVHNGIEYGMMQSLAEGFNLLSHAPYDIPLDTAAYVLGNGSVIEGRLISWLASAFSKYGTNLESVKGSVDALGEGGWALEETENKGLINWVTKASVDYRTYSQKNPDFTGKILSAIRGEFGGHVVTG